MRFSNPASRRAGFTLMELLVVVGLIGVVTSLGTTAFYRVTEVWGEQKALADLDQSLDEAFNEFQADLADAISAELSGESIVGVSSELRSTKYFDRVLADDRIIIPVQHAPVGDRARSGGKVMWKVDRAEGGIAPLARYAGKLRDDTVAGGSETMIRDANVVRLRFEYTSASNPGEWLPEWNRDDLPAAVRMSVTVEGTTRHKVQTSRTAVFPVRVR